jgi:predicted AlkP superfamily pyrophosphatase or phosphodiesterase
LSTKPFTRVLWIVLDGMGYEHARLCLASGAFPALTRIEREGYLGPSTPATPVCQTPPALISLFAGADPAESGVWGYHMPDPRNRELSMSGFHCPIAVHPLWEDMERRGWPYSLMNVAFRNDPLWRGSVTSLTFAYDGYRLWKRPTMHRLNGDSRRVFHEGIELQVRPTSEGVQISKGSRLCGTLLPGETKPFRITAGTRVIAHLLSRSLLVLHSITPPVTRGARAAERAREGFFDANVFRVARRENEKRGAGAIPIDVELAASALSMRQKADLMLSAVDEPSSRLVVGYFPIIDDFNHVYVDALQSGEPNGRASRLFAACAGLVDQLLGRVMDRADDGTLLVVSSDHGAASFQGILHLNELFLRERLVVRQGDGYDLRRSTAFYHPSDCGQVIARDPGDRSSVLAAVRRALDQARTEYGVEIGMQEGAARDPYLAFLYPLGKGYFTGDPPRRGRATLEAKRSGGHHLSPLSPTPWIQAVLGLWSPRSRSLAKELPAIPSGNRGVKDFLLEVMGG